MEIKTNLDLVVDAVVGGLSDDAPATDDAPTLPGGKVVSLDREGYAWATDIFWVYEHIGERVTKAKAGTSGRFALWDYAKKNMDTFMGQLLPKAMQILEKARDKQGDNDVVEDEETKSIAEMSRLLRRAVAEAVEG